MTVVNAELIIDIPIWLKVAAVLHLRALAGF